MTIYKRIVQSIILEFPEFTCTEDGRFYVGGKEITETMECIVAAVEAEPARAESVTEWILLAVDEAAYVKRFIGTRGAA